MKKLTATNDSGYRIAPDDGVYCIYLQDKKANVGITYEYDAACATVQEVEKELQTHTFSEMVQRYKKQCVYRECTEALA